MTVITPTPSRRPPIVLRDARKLFCRLLFTPTASAIRGRHWLALALAAIAGGLALRGLWHGPVARWGGELLYAVMVYALLAAIPVAILAVLRWCGVRTRPWPAIRPTILGVGAFLFCAAIEVFQLTGIPAALGAHNRLWWLIFGSAFSKGDLLFYLIGSICAVGIHHGGMRLARYRVHLGKTVARRQAP